MLDSQWHDFLKEVSGVVDLKLILYWVAGIFGIFLNWFKMWLANEISCDLWTWFSTNKKATITSLLTFLSTGLVLLQMGGFESMTYILSLGAGFAAATSSEAYLNRTDKKFYTGENLGIVGGVKALTTKDEETPKE